MKFEAELWLWTAKVASRSARGTSAVRREQVEQAPRPRNEVATGVSRPGELAIHGALRSGARHTEALAVGDTASVALRVIDE